MKHVISVIVHNKPGVLSRVSGLFSRRGYNIESLAVGETDNPELSRITIAVSGDESILEQIQKQLYKLIDVIKVIDLPKDSSVRRELVLVKVNTEKVNRAEIIQVADIFRGKIVDVGENNLTVS